MNTTLDAGYYQLERKIEHARPMGMLFTTDASGVFEAYLEAIPARKRQVYNCRCCRKFLERYGTLVTIDAEGRTSPAFIPMLAGTGAFAVASQAIHHIVSQAKVTGVFYSFDKTLGDPMQGGWTHLCAANPNRVIESLLTLDQLAAEKREEFGMLKRALVEYTASNARDAVSVLEADAVNGSEKALGIARWFLNTHEVVRRIRSNKRRDNLIWKFVADAPAGFCHIKNTMIHTLMDDLRDGYPLEAVRARWNEKMHPLQYKHPTTVKQGNITQANAVFEKLRADGSLERRFASPSDVTTKLWYHGMRRPARPFDKLRNVSLPRNIGLDTLRSVVLPNAASLEVQIPSAKAPFFALTAPVNPRSPSLFHWGNAIGWYFYHEGSLPSQWGLRAGAWVPASMAIQKPCHWQGNLPNHTDPTLLVLNGMRDTRYVKGGLLFPDFLRSELHPVRSSIEAYSAASSLANVSCPVCGIEAVPGLTIRVNGHDIYMIQ